MCTLILVNLDEELERGGRGGVRLGGKRVYTLAYANDVAMVTVDERRDEGYDGQIGKIHGREGAAAECGEIENNAV